MTKRYAAWIVCAVLSIGLLVGMTINAMPSPEEELATIEMLPASFNLSKGPGPRQIALLRLEPNPSDKRRNLSSLSSNVAIASLKSFDATDCFDFGDSDLARIRNADRLQFLGLDSTAITDKSLREMKNHWPALRFLNVKYCKISQEALIEAIGLKKFVFVDIDDKFNHPDFLENVRAVSPQTIIMCRGEDLMHQPGYLFDAIPWSDWE